MSVEQPRWPRRVLKVLAVVYLSTTRGGLTRQGLLR